MWFALAALAAPTPTTTPPAPPPPAHAEDGPLAPRLFDAAALRAALTDGTHVKMSIEADNAPPLTEDWWFLAADATGVSIRSRTSGEEGVLRDDPPARSTWADLERHASFPVAWTTMADDRITVPAGAFETRRYTVRDPADGSLKVLHFAKALPGPPVWMEVQAPDGTVRMRMTLLARDRAPAPP